jgi:decaprenylphospho-beta-D-erythro-pentofuranosid-2-ulose 2-reductase
MKPTSSSGLLLVLGGTSDIGAAIARFYVKQGWQIQLAGRDLASLEREADDINARMKVSVTVHKFDVLDTSSFAAFLDSLPTLPDAVVCVVGVLGDQSCAESDLDHSTLVMRTNYEGPSLILGECANRFQARGYGTIVGVSSVAGDRGRASNYVYGSAKAGFSAFLSGLRNRLASEAVHVLTVKPGFVRTKMTKGMKLPRALTTEPSIVAKKIYDATQSGRNIIYVRPVWQIIMMAIVLVPEAIFKKMRL